MRKVRGYGRLRRAGRHAALLAGDVKRCISWHVGGGKRFFTRYRDEIAGAHRWCFIVGCNNSGTTLLQEILERACRVSTMKMEGQQYTRVLVRGWRYGRERVWSEFIDEIRMTERDSAATLPRLLHDWMSALEVPVNKVIVEKSTVNAVRMRWLQKVFPDSRFIGIVRNGYAVSEGIRRKGAKSLRRAARHWRIVNSIMLKDKDRVGNFLYVRYEDLVGNPLGTISAVRSFLGLEENSGGDGDRSRQCDQIWDDGIDLASDMNIRSFQRLTGADVAEIEAEAGDLLEALGYRYGQ